MGDPPADYDDRYLAGVSLFNAGEYFDAHEVWEDLWLDCPAADRRFYQSLIQAAVALYHWARGNRPGAARLFDSGRRYMEPYRPRHRGLEVDPFWRAVGAALGGALADDAGRAPGVNPGVIRSDPEHPRVHPRGSPEPPRIVLVPPPARWPDPREVRHD